MANWLELLPNYIAIQQVSWERRRMVARMVSCGLSRKEIAKRLGVGVVRVGQIIAKLECEKSVPVLEYFSKNNFKEF